ncbi:MAG TPA: tetratricopeptide repeat protein, partial [Thermoanaerobaculia bacterium]|nr:tetratricopeptide repeat protein [Thermoanaerobaculia bacterium]
VMQYPSSLAVTWQRSFHQIAPTAQALLRLASFLAPDPIPDAMLESGAELVREAAALLREETGQEAPERPVRDDLSELRALSLVSWQDGTVSVHRLLQEVVRHRIPEERQAAWASLAMKLVSRFAPQQSDDARNWGTWDLLRPHALEVLARGADESLAASSLMTEVGMYLLARGLYPEAEPWMRRALEIETKLLGENHPAAGVCLHNLAMALKSRGRLDEAEAMLRRVLQLARDNPGQERPYLNRHLNALGLVLLDRQQWQESEELLRQALEIDEKRFEEDPGAVARDLHNLSLLYATSGRPAEGEPLIRRSLGIAQDIYGLDHPRTARRLQILAAILRDLGRPDEAEPLARQALGIFEHTLGPDHPSTLSARKDLASLTAA